jgi:hypothetical protein
MASSKSPGAGALGGAAGSRGSDRLGKQIEVDPTPERPPAQRNGVPDARLRRLAAQVRELVAGRDPVECIERYAALPAALIAAFAGDKFPPPRLIAGDAP